MEEGKVGGPPGHTAWERHGGLGVPCFSTTSPRVCLGSMAQRRPPDNLNVTGFSPQTCFGLKPATPVLPDLPTMSARALQAGGAVKWEPSPGGWGLKHLHKPSVSLGL